LPKEEISNNQWRGPWRRYKQPCSSLRLSQWSHWSRTFEALPQIVSFTLAYCFNVAMKKHQNVSRAWNYLRASHRKPRDWNNVHDHLSKNSLSMLFHPSGDLKENYKCYVEFGSAKLPNQKYAQHCPILDSYSGWDLWGVKETKGWQDNFCMQFVFSSWGISLYFGILMH
jgi:hypothetical protein